MRPARIIIGIATAFVLATVAGCTTYRDDLERGQKAFDQNAHERALAIFQMLEPDLEHLSSAERAQYFYLRGMSDYRIGYQADARHWLLLAKASDDREPGAVPPQWKPQLDDAIKALDETVYADGMAGLSSTSGKKATPSPSSQ